MKHQRGLALSQLIFWGIIIALVAVLGMKVVPTTVEYYKILKDAKASVNKVGPEATVADVRKTFDNYAKIEHLEFKASQLEIFKENGRIIASFDYEKRIPLFANVSLLIRYQGLDGTISKVMESKSPSAGARSCLQRSQPAADRADSSQFRLSQQRAP